MKTQIKNLTHLKAKSLQETYQRIAFDSNGGIERGTTSSALFHTMIRFFFEEMHAQRAFFLELKAVGEATGYLSVDDEMQAAIDSVENMADTAAFRDFFALEKGSNGTWDIEPDDMIEMLFRTWCIDCETHEQIAIRMIETIEFFGPPISELKPILEQLQYAHRHGLRAKNPPKPIPSDKSGADLEERKPRSFGSNNLHLDS